MSLDKRTAFDHSQESVFDAAGYSEDVVEKELEPRAALLANEIMDMAGMCPTMAIEILMDSPILRDPVLDNRDRAVIVLLAAPVIAATIIRRAMDNPTELQKACISNHGFNHITGRNENEVLKMSKTEWDTLINYAQGNIFGEVGQLKASELIENMEKFFNDATLTSLQKAIVQAFVIKSTARETASSMTLSPTVIGPLATVGRL
jgi:hypothetical protein